MIEVVGRKPKPKMRRVQLKLEGEMYAKVARLAKKRRATFTAMVEAALEMLLEAVPPKRKPAQ